MILKSLKKQANNEKYWLIKGKSTKIALAFIQNKANFKNIKIFVSFFETSKYAILTACRTKKQTQFKANSNPIPERSKMNINPYIRINYEIFLLLLGEVTKPNKPNTNPILHPCPIYLSTIYSAL